MGFPIWSKIQMWPIQATMWSLTFPIFSCTRCCLHPLYVTLCAESVATICTVPSLYHMYRESITVAMYCCESAICCYLMLSVATTVADCCCSYLLQLTVVLQPSLLVFWACSSSGGTPHAAARSATCVRLYWKSETQSEKQWKNIKNNRNCRNSGLNSAILQKNSVYEEL